MSALQPISFARGAPSLDIIDVEGLRAAADRAISNDPSGLFLYGTAVGYPPLRSWLAERYSVAPEQVLVTNGSMQADAFLFELLVEPGDVVVTERPTYDRTLLSLRNRGADIRMINLEPDGINVTALEQLLSEGVKPKLAHIIPNFQNPAGVTLSLEKRQRLIELAAAYDFLIFEDDPYIDVRFAGERLPMMFELDQSGNVVYVSSFTKTVCPGVRVGYMVGTEELIGRALPIATNTYISPSMFSQGTVYEFCREGGLERSIETVRAALRERADTLASALTQHLPEAKFNKPAGGYFMWVDLPDSINVGELFDAAAERNVAIVKGTDFMLDGGEHSMRLAYSAVGPVQIEQGIQRLAEAVSSLAPV